MKLLLLGDLNSTGFGTVTTDLGRALIDAGTDVRFVAFIDEASQKLPDWLTGRVVEVIREPGWLTFEERESAAARMELRMRNLFSPLGYTDGWWPDAALVLGDPSSVINSGIGSLVPAGFPAYHYVPVEGVGIPPSWAAIWQNLRPIAMCKFGATELGRMLGREVPFFYHGIDTDIFRPATPKSPIVLQGQTGEVRITSRSDAKRFFNIDPKTTIVLRADRFMPRKRYPSLMRAMAPVLAKHPDAFFVMHMRPLDEGGNLVDFLSHFPPFIRERMGTLGLWEQYGAVPREVLATIYNAADLYVTNGAEGFGLTIAEAMACGVPVVGLDFSSVPEVIGPAGLTVPVGRMVENIFGYWWAEADERKFAEAVHELIANKTHRWRLAALATGHVKANFTWAGAAQTLLGIIEQREAVAA